MLSHQTHLWRTGETLTLPDYVKQRGNKPSNVQGKDLGDHPVHFTEGKFCFECFIHFTALKEDPSLRGQ